MIYLRRCRANLTPSPSSSPSEPNLDLANLDLSYYKDLESSKPFSPSALRAHMDTWILVLASHLKDEIQTLHPEYFDRIGKEEEKEVDRKAQEMMQVYDPAWFLLGCR